MFLFLQRILHLVVIVALVKYQKKLTVAKQEHTIIQLLYFFYQLPCSCCIRDIRWKGSKIGQKQLGENWMNKYTGEKKIQV